MFILTCKDEASLLSDDAATLKELKSPKSDSSFAGFAESNAPKSAKLPLPV